MNILKKAVIKGFSLMFKAKTLLCFCLYGRYRDFLLLLTPTHGNLGDHAIAIAEREFLEKEGVSFFEVTAEALDGLFHFYARVSQKKQNVLVHGGGFLGTIWKKEELRFRSVLMAFSDKKIIVLPQTITFDMQGESGQLFFKESYEIYKKNKGSVFFLRDSNSVAFSKSYLPALHVRYVPDIVLSWTPKYVKKWAARDAVLFLTRQDTEKKLSADDVAGIEDAVRTKLGDITIVYGDTCVNRKIFPFQRKKAVLGKLAEISKYRLVITDRLHGMVFAYLTGTPCIALDNKNGKVKAVYQWIMAVKNICFVDELHNVCKAIENVLSAQDIASLDFTSRFNDLKQVLKERI